MPKIETPERGGWSEEQHDTDRLSRALAAYVLVGLCGIDDTMAVGAITDGKNDGGIDALFFDRTGSRLVFVQAKFKRGGAAPSQEEMLKTINGIRALLERRFGDFNQAIQGRLDEIEEALDTAGVRIEVVPAFLGDTLGPHATADLNALQADMNRFAPRMAWEAAGLSKVHNWLIAEQMPVTVNAQVTLENWSCITAPRNAVYGQISAAELAQLVEDHGKALFERNIRHYLGSVGVNLAIERTVRGRPGDFFYLNNGLTAVADRITPAAGTNARCVFGFKNLSIVNGAQTAGSIANAAIAGTISPDAKLLITIIEIGPGAGDFGLEITRARNHQNVVRGVDFAALDPNQERLRQELALAGITYHYRPSAEARARREDAFTLEEAAVALACLSFPVVHSRDAHAAPRRAHPNAVDLVVTAKKEIGRLWEQDGAHYGQIFTPSLSGLKTCRAVRIFGFIDQILADSERSETAYHRRMFFRHGRYFVMAFVAHRLPDLIRRSDLALSEADRTTLSRKVNELSELIYAVSHPWLTSKGYLSIFRNLTDAQPLANAVLDRLAEQDAAARLAASSTPASTSSPSSGTHNP
ncbi:AIPR family protein [Rhodospirillum centenum]|uniref:AIPR family protein n=1 Tax=Rhodospirillum centenum TaxID=34018 RepID=UPI0016121C1C|nr:AIPR family protein [Rhodospirillum centenum]